MRRIDVSADWTTRPLAELVEVIGIQINPSAQPTKMFNYIAMENIESGTGRIVSFAPTRGSEIGSNKIAFKKGDVLYGRLRPYLRKVAVAPFDGVSATDILPLRPLGAISPEFLREFLLSPAHSTYVSQLMSGARMPRLRTSDLLRLPVPAPDEPAANELVEKVCAFRHRVHVIRTQLESVRDLIAMQRSAVLAKAESGDLSEHFRKQLDGENGRDDFLSHVSIERRRLWEQAQRQRLEAEGRLAGSDEWKARYPEPVQLANQKLLALPPGWRWATLAQLTSAVEPICYGVVQPGEDSENGVPLIRVQDVQDGAVDWATVRHIDKAVEASYARSRLRGGEVLVTVVGASIGKIAVVSDTAAGANIVRALAKVSPLPSVGAGWLAMILSAPRVQRWMTTEAREVARATLNISTLEQAPIPLPPPEEIREILRLQDAIERGTRSLEVKVIESENLITSLLDRTISSSFEGRTVLRKASNHSLMQAQEFYRKVYVTESVQGNGGRRRLVTRTKPKPSGGIIRRRDFVEVLTEYPSGLEPLRLLEEAGYTLAEVESFYRQLANDVAHSRVREVRPDGEASRIEVMSNADR